MSGDAHLHVGLKPVDSTNPVPVAVVFGSLGGGDTGGATEATLATRASEASQLLGVAAMQATRDRLPATLQAGRVGVAVLGTPVLYASTTASTAVQTLELGTTATMVSLQAEEAGVAFAFGTSSNAAASAAGQPSLRIRVPAGASRDFMIPPGMTHIAWIRTGTTNGVASIVGLV